MIKNAKTSKKIVAVLITLLLFVQLGIGAFAYSDVKSGDWFGPVVNKWGSLLTNDTNFEPNKAITRAEFAMMLNKLLKFPAAASTFSDTAGNPYANDIGALCAAGVVNGVGDNKFNPAGGLTRQDAAKAIGIAFGLTPDSSALTYEDAAQIADYAKGYVKACEKIGYFIGNGKNFMPKELFSRAEICQLFENIGVNYVNTTTTPINQPAANTLITAPGTIVKDKTLGNVVIAPSVGSGDVSFVNCKINGTLYVLGGGENSIKVDKTTVINRVVISTDANNKTSLRIEQGGVVTVIEIKDCSQGINIFGNFDEVYVDSSVPVVINGNCKKIVITGKNANTTLAAGFTAGEVYIAPGAGGAKFENNGTCTSITDAAGASTVTVGTNGKVDKLNVTGSAVGAEVVNNGQITTLGIRASGATLNNQGTVTNATVTTETTTEGTEPINVIIIGPQPITELYPPEE